MKWSWKLATVAGIGIYVHWTFLLIIGWIVMVRLNDEQATAASVAEGVAFVLAIFGCIVLHELGHALTAKRYGIKTRDITLLPIGGLARLERMPEQPHQEFWVALAGPAVNVVIAAVLYVVLRMTRGATAFEPESLANNKDFLLNLLEVNVFLVLFNLLPAFPMDGGRVLRAVLAHFSGDFVGATQVAASIGQMMAILFGFIGLFFNPFLLFIALFVYLGAQEEAHMVQMRSLFRGLPVREAMMTQVRTLAPHDTLGVARRELLAGSQQDFPVLDEGRFLGLLTRQKMLEGLAEAGEDAPLRNYLQTDCGTAEDTEMLDATFQRMQERGCPTLPVVHAGQLVGMITLENVGELMMIRSASQQRLARSQVRDVFANR